MNIFSLECDLSNLNLAAAWIGVMLGFLSGMLLGLGFHREEFLGGYGSRKRRMYRLGHISFFGLAVANFMFWGTITAVGGAGAVSSSGLGLASLAFIVGAVAMPVCCVLMAHWISARHLFAIPVVSLLIGAGLTLNYVLQNL